LDIRQYWDSNDELSLKAEFSLVLRHLKQPFARRQKNCFAACNSLNWPCGCSQKGIKMDNFMKIRIALGLFVVLGAGFISVRAADTPAQAAARVALEQKLNHPDDSPVQSLPATNTLSEAVVEQPAKSATTVTETVPEKAVTPQTTPVATTPVAAPAAVSPAEVVPAAVAPAAISPAVVAPAVVAPAAVAPAAVSPAAVAPSMTFLILSLLFLSLLLIVLLIMLLLLLKLRQLKLLLLKHPAVVAPREIQPAAAKASPSTERRGKRC
jgi:hypothetical protein